MGNILKNKNKKWKEKISKFDENEKSKNKVLTFLENKLNSIEIELKKLDKQSKNK